MRMADSWRDDRPRLMARGERKGGWTRMGGSRYGT